MGGATKTTLLVVLLFSAIATADARTRRHRNPVRAALQPLFVARAIVHAVAEPVVYHAPRAAAMRPRYSDHEVGFDEEIHYAPAVTHRQPADYPRAVRVAYIATRPRQLQAPPTESFDYAGEDDEAESAPPEIISRGSGPTVRGNRAVLRNGIAHAPANAPEAVKRAIWAGNELRGKPYVWGGGHRSFHDRGYDCSGTVSYALRAAGALSSPLPSSQFMRYGERGRGRWITVYVRNGHTFAVIAGLRLDTTDFRRGGNTGPRWHSAMRDTRGFIARHPAGL